MKFCNSDNQYATAPRRHTLCLEHVFCVFLNCDQKGVKSKHLLSLGFFKKSVLDVFLFSRIWSKEPLPNFASNINPFHPVRTFQKVALK